MIKLYVPNAISGPIVIYPNIWGKSFWIFLTFMKYILFYAKMVKV
jgi:hypothetical protein